DVYNLYDIIANEIGKQKKDGMDVSDTYIGGFSLGGFQSLKIHELDSQKKKINIKKSLLLNTPVDILTSSKILDNYLVKNGIYDASTLEKYIDTIFKKILFDDSIQMKDMNPENIQNILARSELGDKDLEVMIGLLFRFYSANMTFSGEMFEGKGDRILKGNKPPKRFDSLTNYFLEGLSVSYAEYSKDILYPYVNKRLSTNTYTYEKFKEMFSLKSSSDFIKANGDNIIYLTSADDLLMTKEDFAYVNSTFKNKIILPYGGHTGILWHKEVSKLMVDKLEEGGTK
ncbi:MAG: alpha/beta hydrolase, partial [Leptotrichiaceae bacterium]